MLWIVTAIWLAAFAVTAWRFLRAPSRGGLIAYLVVGLIGLVPYLWLLLAGQLPDLYRHLMTAFWVLLAVASTALAVRRRRTGR